MATFSFQSITIGIIEISYHYPDIDTGIVSFYFYRYTSLQMRQITALFGSEEALPH